MELSKNDFHFNNFDFLNTAAYFGGVSTGIYWLLKELCKLRIGANDPNAKLKQIEFYGEIIGSDGMGLPTNVEKYFKQVEKAVLGMVRSNLTDRNKTDGLIYGGLVAAGTLQKLGYHKYFDPSIAYYLLDESEGACEAYCNATADRPESNWRPEGYEDDDFDFCEYACYYHPEDYEDIYQLCLRIIDAEPIETTTTVSPFAFNTINMIIPKS